MASQLDSERHLRLIHKKVNPLNSDGLQRDYETVSVNRRMKMLYDSKSLAPNDCQKFKSAWKSAGKQYRQALASEKISGKHLAYARLSSPVNGFISKRFIEPGEMASPGQAVFEIVQLDPAEVSVGIPEIDVPLVHTWQERLRDGAAVSMTMTDAQGKKATAPEKGSRQGISWLSPVMQSTPPLMSTFGLQSLWPPGPLRMSAMPNRLPRSRRLNWTNSRPTLTGSSEHCTPEKTKDNKDSILIA
ncbi:HlyD family secretion protein [Syntrophus gentianae]|uniref:HlyD family secretion protein n=1 Tax=Syntrophus gentianae TaxID=43775 RepID=A0A1H7W380_9BACT|nr:HlyD family efflux transporter periplasmic adaptor subunit [Syntrophus gentianae]SEM15950.1 HlyD family secretion protein [Syntrophus gentianae]